MKKSVTALAVGLLGVAAVLHSGCEWSGGGGTDSFNTSQGAGINVNFSGVYKGTLAGGKAVSKTSNGNITQFTLTQNGNSAEVTDNQGSHYKGSFGAPGLVANPESDGTYPAGAEVAQSQVTWSGHDNVSGKQIEFVGVIHIVTVTDVKGTSKTETHTSGSSSGSTNSSSSGSSGGTSRTTTTSVDNGTNTTLTTVVTIGEEGDEFFQQTVTTVTIDDATGQEISRNVTTSGSNSSGSSSGSGKEDTVTTVTTTEYSIDESGGNWRLQGTWVEKGGVTASVDALSPGGVTITTTIENSGPGNDNTGTGG